MRSNVRARWSLGLALMAMGMSLAADAGGNLPKLKTQVKRLAVFKNGLGFVVREGQAELRDGWATMDPLPQAALGTLWFGGGAPGVQVGEVNTFQKEPEPTTRPAENLAELLQSNVGRKVMLTHAVGARVEPLECTIVSISGQLVMLRLGDGKLLGLRNDQVLSLQLPEDGVLSVPTKTKVENGARIRVSGGGSSARIVMAYLERGLNWSPAYRIEIADEKQAEIALEAILANDMEELEDTEVSFVVGYPNFAFAGLITPLASREPVMQFLGQLAGMEGGSYGRRGDRGIMVQSLSNAAPFDESSSGGDFSPAAGMGGESNEDLYFYRQEHVTLKRGERARFPVFMGRVPFEHIYRWEVPDYMNVNEYGGRTGSDPSESAEQVWHSLRLENTTSSPWTTAPALAVNGALPVAQDVLRYTPPGGRQTLRLTVATDVRAEQSQIETGRKVVMLSGDDHDEVTVAGKLKLKNWKDKPVKLNVVKTLVGDVQQASREGKIRKLAKRLTAVNPNSEIEWEFIIEPKAEVELTYGYLVWLDR